MKRTMRCTAMYSLFGAAAVLLVVLTGCMGPSGEKKKAKRVVSTDEVVVVSIDKEPVLTESEFKEEVAAMTQGRVAFEGLPMNVKRKAAEDIGRYKLNVKLAEEAGIEKHPEFKEAFDKQLTRLREMLLVRVYDVVMLKKMDVTDAEAKQYFEENQDRFIKEPGGVLVSGVSFSDSAKANAFYEAVKSKNAEDFASVGKKEKDGKFREFGRVGEEAAAPGGYSFVPAAVKTAANKLSKLPGVDLVKDGKDIWVVHVSDRKEATKFAYEEIEERLKSQLRFKKLMDHKNAEYERISKEKPVELNEEYFAEPVAVTDVAAPSEAPAPAGGEGSEAL